MEEPRHVKLQKGAEPLGISIVSGEKGGVYVSKVTGGSIAHQAGLEYGDQLLEVRAAPYPCLHHQPFTSCARSLISPTARCLPHPSICLWPVTHCGRCPPCPSEPQSPALPSTWNSPP